MSVANVVSQLRGLVDKANTLIPKFAKVYPSEQQWEDLGSLSEQLAMAANKIKKDIRESKESRGQRAWKESEKLRSQALACKGELLTTGRLKLPPVFRRNIVTIFEGPKSSKFDSEENKLRKASTLQRCKQIRQLSPSGVVSWAISFAPTVWAAGSMPTDIFNCLLDDIEPDCRPSWPSVVRETLYILQEDEKALQHSEAYQEFLREYDNPANPNSDCPEYDNPANPNSDCRKRKRLYSYGQEMQPNQGHPSNGGRGMKNFPPQEGMANYEW
jgi:hypothetical protein